jgi:hypothetical protein
VLSPNLSATYFQGAKQPINLFTAATSEIAPAVSYAHLDFSPRIHPINGVIIFPCSLLVLAYDYQSMFRMGFHSTNAELFKHPLPSHPEMQKQFSRFSTRTRAHP